MVHRKCEDGRKVLWHTAVGVGWYEGVKALAVANTVVSILFDHH